MKRFNIIILLLCAVTLGVQAQGLERGRRSMVDWGFDLHSHGGWELPDLQINVGGSYTTGYQFNPNFFLGGGAELTFGVTMPEINLPIYVDVRTDQNWGGFTPFADFRLGWQLTNEASGHGFYCSPTIGYRFLCGKNGNGLNVGLGMDVKGRYSGTKTTTEYNAANNSYSVTEIETNNIFAQKYQANFVFRVGIDF